MGYSANRISVFTTFSCDVGSCQSSENYPRRTSKKQMIFYIFNLMKRRDQSQRDRSQSRRRRKGFVSSIQSSFQQSSSGNRQIQQRVRKRVLQQQRQHQLIKRQQQEKTRNRQRYREAQQQRPFFQELMFQRLPLAPPPPPPPVHSSQIVVQDQPSFFQQLEFQPINLQLQAYDFQPSVTPLYDEPLNQVQPAQPPVKPKKKPIKKKQDKPQKQKPSWNKSTAVKNKQIKPIINRRPLVISQGPPGLRVPVANVQPFVANVLPPARNDIVQVHVEQIPSRKRPLVQPSQQEKISKKSKQNQFNMFPVAKRRLEINQDAQIMTKKQKKNQFLQAQLPKKRLATPLQTDQLKKKNKANQYQMSKVPIKRRLNQSQNQEQHQNPIKKRKHVPSEAAQQNRVQIPSPVFRPMLIEAQQQLNRKRRLNSPQQSHYLQGRKRKRSAPKKQIAHPLQHQQRSKRQQSSRAVQPRRRQRQRLQAQHQRQRSRQRSRLHQQRRASRSRQRPIYQQQLQRVQGLVADVVQLVSVGLVNIVYNRNRGFDWIGQYVQKGQHHYFTNRFVKMRPQFTKNVIYTYNQLVETRYPPGLLILKLVVPGTNVVLIKDRYKERDYIGMRMQQMIRAQGQPILTRNGFNLTPQQMDTLIKRLRIEVFR